MAEKRDRDVEFPQADQNVTAVLGIALILGGALLRLSGLPPNATPILALGLFSGMIFSNRWAALLVPVLSVGISDYLLGSTPELYSVYLPLTLAIVLARVLSLSRKKGAWPRILASTLGASATFFFLSNLSVWWSSGMYEPTWRGWIECYTMALPFWRNELVGNGVGVIALGASWQVIQRLSAVTAAKKM